MLLYEKMLDIICQLNIYRRTYKWASQPAGLEGIVGVLSG